MWTKEELEKLSKLMQKSATLTFSQLVAPPIHPTATQQRMAMDNLTYGKYRIPGSQAYSNPANGTSTVPGGAGTPTPVSFTQLHTVLTWNSMCAYERVSLIGHFCQGACESTTSDARLSHRF